MKKPVKNVQNKFTKEMVIEVHQLVNDLGMGHVLATQIVAQNHGLTTQTAKPNWMQNRDRGYH